MLMASCKGGGEAERLDQVRVPVELGEIVRVQKQLHGEALEVMFANRVQMRASTSKESSPNIEVETKW